MNKRIAVIVPVLNEENIIDPLLDRLFSMSDELPYDFRFIMVEDGSDDGTLAALLRRQETDARVTIVKLSRNWGHQNAFNAGLDFVADMGFDATVMMDGDLEDPPELILKMISQWEKGAEVVYTIKKSRHGSRFRMWLTYVYYKLLNAIGEHTTPHQAGMFSLLDAKVLKEILNIKEGQKSYPNIRTFVGFRQVAVEYDRESRKEGQASQSLLNLMNDGVNAIISTSLVPIRVMTLFGVFLLFGNLLLVFTVVLVRLTGFESDLFPHVEGWTSVIVILLIIFSILLIFLGILGEYIARIYHETRGRPNYIVDQIISSPDKIDPLEGKDKTSE